MDPARHRQFLQKSLNLSGAISVYRTVSCISSEVLLRSRVPSLASLNCRRWVEPFGGPAQQELYAKTLPKCRLESAMNSMLAHRKNACVFAFAEDRSGRHFANWNARE